jgi:hypothetical protein
MFLTITEKETKEAVVEWLDRHHGIKTPDKLLPVFETESDYEHTTNTHNGFRVELDQPLKG